MLAFALLAALPPNGARAAEYSRRPLLTGSIQLEDDVAAEVALSTPAVRRRQMCQLEIAFSTGAGRNSLASGGAVALTATLLGDDGGRYTADIVNGDLYPGGVRAKFVSLPPRNVALRKLVLRGRNVRQVGQVYWLEGMEKLSTGVDEDPRHCGKDRCRWNEAMDYCSGRGGRLLTLSELKAMYEDECGSGEPCRDAFWSATEYAPFPRRAWYVDFADGSKVAAEKIQLAYVRCMVPASARYSPRAKRGK